MPDKPPSIAPEPGMSEPGMSASGISGPVRLAPLSGPLRLWVITLAGVLFLASVAALTCYALMTPRPILPASVPGWAMALHLLCVVPAVPLGAVVVLRRKGDALHKRLGRLWGGLMVGAALSSFALTGVAGARLSPIHLLSVLTLVSVPLGVFNARRGQIAAHRRAMLILYASLLGAGAFAFLPVRILGQWLAG